MRDDRLQFEELEAARERIAALEAERDAAIKVVDENWVTHQQVAATNKTIGILEESVLAMGHEISQRNARIAELEDAARQVTPIVPESLIEQSKLIARIAELEAERDELRAKLDVSETFEEHNKGRIAALEAEQSSRAWDWNTQHLRDRVAELEAERGKLLDWAVCKWHNEVSNRPLVNVHRRTLDDTWRQVIRYAGGDPVELVGLTHDDLLAQEEQP